MLPPIYIDNAATTAITPPVYEAMKPYLTLHYGNPSAAHRLGNEVRVAIEKARKQMIALLGGGEGQLFFTSGATEANNWAIRGIIEEKAIRHVITSPLEHASVYTTIAYLGEKEVIVPHYVAIDAKGDIDLDDLARLIKRYPGALVSLMHGHNEIGNITDIAAVGRLCREAGSFFHSDRVQSVAYIEDNLATLPVDMATGTAHKLHGPKGMGWLYLREGLSLPPLLYGGAQERGMRAGTENVAAIVGGAKAVAIAYQDREQHRERLRELKGYLVEHLPGAIEGLHFNGRSGDLEASLPHILHLRFPWKRYSDTLLMWLEMRNIYGSQGSACTSGAVTRSHVLGALGISAEVPVLRISLGKLNTMAEMERLVETLGALDREAR